MSIESSHPPLPTQPTQIPANKSSQPNIQQKIVVIAQTINSSTTQETRDAHVTPETDNSGDREVSRESMGVATIYVPVRRPDMTRNARQIPEKRR